MQEERQSVTAITKHCESPGSTLSWFACVIKNICKISLFEEFCVI